MVVEAEPGPEAVGQRRSRIVVAAYGAVALTFAVAHLSAEPYDDAHFFKRIARNALEYGVAAWNIDEGPVYGATSQSFQLIATVLTALTTTHSMLAVRAFSLACLLAAFALLYRSSERSDRGASVVVAFCSAILLFPIVTGMETALAVLAVTLLLELTHGRFAEPPASRYLVPIAFSFLYATRPDAAILGAVLVADRWSKLGGRSRKEVATTVALLATLLIAFKGYYGSALPLPFFAKQKALSPYDSHFLELSARVGWQRFCLFAVSVLCLGVRGLSLRDRTNVVLLGGSGLFIGFHLLSTVDVMGMQGRFYVPCVPLLVLASARAIGQHPKSFNLTKGMAGAVAFIALVAALRALNALPSGQSLGVDGMPSYLRAAILVGGAGLLVCTSFRKGTSALVA